MSRRFFRDSSRRNRKKRSKIKRLSPLANLLAAGLGSAALAVAQSNPYPTYATGPRLNGSWVVSVRHPHRQCPAELHHARTGS